MHRFRNSEGSVMITAAICAGLLALLTGAYLYHVSNQGKLDSRRQQWQQSLYLAETAVEVGLNELTWRYMKGAKAFEKTKGWTDLSGKTNFVKTVTNFKDLNGNVVGDYTVTVSGIKGTNPQIIGVGTCANLSGSSVSRAVSVIVGTAGQRFAFLAKTSLSLNGNKLLIDSYNSSDPSKSTNGQYDPAKAQANGDIGCLNASNVDVASSDGNAQIYGRVYTAPGGTVTMSAGGSVGPTFDPALRAYDVPTGESMGYILHNLSASMPDVQVQDWFFDPATIDLGAVTGPLTLTAGDYRASSISINSDTKALTITGEVRLYVTGDLSISGTGLIDIQSNSSLDYYTDGGISVSGKGVVNGGAAPIYCRFYGLPTVTKTWTYSGRSAFYGMVYAPTVDVKFTGGSAAYYGSITANNISGNGSIQFHLDEAVSARRSFVVRSWKEYRNIGGTWVQ
jgi:hypothetical protein